jgi:hypothetical protein
MWWQYNDVTGAENSWIVKFTAHRWRDMLLSLNLSTTKSLFLSELLLHGVKGLNTKGETQYIHMTSILFSPFCPESGLWVKSWRMTVLPLPVLHQLFSSPQYRNMLMGFLCSVTNNSECIAWQHYEYFSFTTLSRLHQLAESHSNWWHNKDTSYAHISSVYACLSLFLLYFSARSVAQPTQCRIADRWVKWCIGNGRRRNRSWPISKH